MPTRAQLENRLLELDVEEASQTYLRNRPWERSSISVGGALPNSQGSYPWELQAEAEAAARFKNPRAGGLDSAQNVFAQLPDAFGPGRMTPPAPPSKPDVFRNVGGNLVKIDSQTGEASAVFTAPEKSQNLTAFERNSALYWRQLKDAEEAQTDEEKALFTELAGKTKAWLDKQGRFAPPKPATQSTTEGVRQVINPLYKDNTNASPFLSLTNRSHRLSEPVAQPEPYQYRGLGNKWYEKPSESLSPFDRGLREGMGSSSSTNSGIKILNIRKR